jgi:hypothetical protein
MHPGRTSCDKAPSSPECQLIALRSRSGSGPEHGRSIASVTIRNLDDGAERRLRQMAAARGRFVEEVRNNLHRAGRGAAPVILSEAMPDLPRLG